MATVFLVTAVFAAIVFMALSIFDPSLLHRVNYLIKGAGRPQPTKSIHDCSVLGGPNAAAAAAAAATAALCLTLARARARTHARAHMPTTTSGACAPDMIRCCRGNRRLGHE